MKRFIENLFLIALIIFMLGFAPFVNAAEVKEPVCNVNETVCDDLYCPDSDMYWRFYSEDPDLTGYRKMAGYGYCSKEPKPFDECTNLNGIQLVVPQGLVQMPTTQCILPSQVVPKLETISFKTGESIVTLMSNGTGGSDLPELVASTSTVSRMPSISELEQIEALQKQLIALMNQLISLLRLKNNK